MAAIGVIPHDEPDPPYVILAGRLRDLIDNGSITGRLPSESWLMQETGLARSTVRRAIKRLSDEGVIYTVAHRGSWVAG